MNSEDLINLSEAVKQVFGPSAEVIVIEYVKLAELMAWAGFMGLVVSVIVFCLTVSWHFKTKPDEPIALFGVGIFCALIGGLSIGFCLDGLSRIVAPHYSLLNSLLP